MLSYWSKNIFLGFVLFLELCFKNTYCMSDRVDFVMELRKIMEQITQQLELLKSGQDIDIALILKRFDEFEKRIEILEGASLQSQEIKSVLQDFNIFFYDAKRYIFRKLPVGREKKY